MQSAINGHFSPTPPPAASQGSKAQTITCPNQGLASIKMAQYGGGLTWKDTTDDVAMGCSGSTCNVDITKMENWQGQTLRVEFECSCGAGMKADRDKVTQACVPCRLGMFRKLGMPECEACPAGKFQDQPGQVRRHPGMKGFVPSVLPPTTVDICYQG